MSASREEFPEDQKKSTKQDPTKSSSRFVSGSNYYTQNISTVKGAGFIFQLLTHYELGGKEIVYKMPQASSS